MKCNYSLLAQLGTSSTPVSLGRSVKDFLDLTEEKQQISQGIPKPGCFPPVTPSPLDREVFPLQDQGPSFFIHSYSYPGKEGNGNIRFTSLNTSLLMTSVCF